MRYLKFVVSNYRAIVGPLEIDVSKPRLLPIIGINESGKTTVLHALFAFDHYNDDLNDDGRQLRDTANLYRTSPPKPTVTAWVEFSRYDFDRAVTAAAAEKQYESIKADIAAIKKKRGIPTTFAITRDLKSKRYSIEGGKFGTADVQHALAATLISGLPYILFFDDFRDKIEEKIEIVATKDDSGSGWIAIVEQLFKQTDKNLSVFQIGKLEERQRKTILARVQRRLNETLTKEWQNFRLDDRDALEIAIEFLVETAPDGGKRQYIKFDVVEVDTEGNQHFFYIADRSKGFYWFFNFVMKLEFNPKVLSTSATTIYLLDEPGSYLHAFAQSKLCKKLRQLAEKNCVLYCTHSHYLLDPDTIPVSSIHLAEKDGNGRVSLHQIIDYKGHAAERRSALQPVIDALQIKPFALDVIGTKTTIIVEGIYDYFALDLFKNNRSVAILPSVNAESIQFYVSFFIAWQLGFRALWDSDQEGRQRFDQAKERFGDEIAKRYFRLLPRLESQPKRIIQDLFDGSDLVMIRAELGLATDTSFTRTIHAWYYSALRGEIALKISPRTRQNFEDLFASLELE